MRFKTVLAGTAVAWLAFFGTGTPGQDKKESTNLLVNGSFEEGPDAEAYKPLDEDSTEIKGWIVTRGQIDYIGTLWKAADGKRCLDLHGSPGFGGVKQTFTTKEGQRYRVSFSLAGSPGRGEKKLGVRAAGKKTSYSFDATSTTAEEMGWVTKTWEFTAIADHTSLEIHTLETEDPTAGPALDNVAVVAIDP
jgi:choice-of-anchor C domain-containing protein